MTRCTRCPDPPRQILGIRGEIPERTYFFIWVIFEPSNVKLYINPSFEKMKPMMGFFAVSVSIAPPVPRVANATLPSTPAFYPLVLRNFPSASAVIKSTI